MKDDNNLPKSTWLGNYKQTFVDKCGITIKSVSGKKQNQYLRRSKTVPNIGTSIYAYDIIAASAEWNIYIGAGETAEGTKDPKGNKTVKVFDKAGRLKTVLADGQVTRYNYNSNGSRLSVDYPGGAREEYTYYADGLLRTLTNKNTDGSVIETYTYTYDASHNQITKTDAKGETSYIYDALNRLKQVSEPTGKTTRYTYDKAGNRESETILASDVIITENIYNYNDQNRLTTVTTKASGAADVITEYRYDGNGNELSITVNGTETARNTYDKLNRLISTNANSREVTNTYNGEGQRVTKAVNGTVTRYLYEYDKVVLETDGAGTQTARNVYGTNLLTKTADGQKYYYMYNGHADVTALINANGQIAGTHYYDAFGNIQEHTGIDSNMTYAGYQYDKETGLYYLNARMYDPKIARFLQEDTYTGDRNDPLSLNLYSYCANNPIIYWDPTGHTLVRINHNVLAEGANKLGSKIINFLQDKFGDDVPTPNHYIPQDVRERMAADPGNQPIFGNITPYQIALDIKYNTDEEYRSLVDEDRATNWKTEGSVYGIKAGVANIVNIPYNIAKLADYKIPDHIRYSDTPKYNFRGITDPFYVPTHKQPYFEESKRSFKENAMQGRVAFEGAFMYASMGGTELFKYLITKAPAVASNGIVISESFGSNGISYLDEITMSEDAFFSSLRSRSIPYNAVNGTGSLVSYARNPSDIFIEAGVRPGEWERIAPKNLHRELRSSGIGRETLDIIETKNLYIDLDYGIPPANNVMGQAQGNYNSIYIKNTQSVQKTAETVIHEVTHSGLGIRGSQRDEIIAFMRGAKHTNPDLPFGDIRKIISNVKNLYPELPYKK